MIMNEIDLSRADLNLLVVFDVVHREGHVGRAASRLSLSQSAVSHSLRRLRRLMNDPLFIKTPRGVVATDRARSLAGPVAEVLRQVRAVLDNGAPFDPATSQRRFVIGAPDGVSVVFLAALLSEVETAAPFVAVSIRQQMPTPATRNVDQAWGNAFEELDARTLDVAIIPTAIAPASFQSRRLFREDFVLAIRAGHPLAIDPSLDRYCEARHLVVSASGEPEGFVDQALKVRGRSRRVCVTAPSFMFALPVLAETDLVAALPRRFVEHHAARYDLTFVEPPFDFGGFELHAVTKATAVADDGLAWLLDIVAACSRHQAA